MQQIRDIASIKFRFYNNLNLERALSSLSKYTEFSIYPNYYIVEQCLRSRAGHTSVFSNASCSVNAP